MDELGRGQPRALGLLLGWAVFGVFWGGWGALLPAVKEASDASNAELGLALLFVPVAALPTMLLMGRLADRFGGAVVAPSLLLFGLSAAATAGAQSVPLLIAAVALLGASSGALDIAITAGVSSVEVERDRPLLYKAHAIFSLAGLCGAVTVGLVRGAGGSHEPIVLALGAVSWVAALANAGRWAPRMLRGERRRPGRRPLTRRLGLLGVVAATAYLVENGLEQWSAIHLEESLSAAPAVSGLGPGLFSAALFAGRSLAQWRGHRLGPARLVALAGAATAAGVGVAAAAEHVALALFGIVLAGLGLAAAAPSVISLAGREANDETRGATVSTVTTIAYTGYLIGPACIGAASSIAGTRIGFAVIGVFGVVMLTFAPLVKPATATGRTRPRWRRR